MAKPTRRQRRKYKVIKANDSVRFDTNSAGRGFMSHKRAVTNTKQGVGVGGDIVENTRVSSYRGFNRPYLESLYINFWSAAKAIDLKVDDVFSPGIVWAEDTNETEIMKEEMDRLMVLEEVPKAVKAGRLFGTAILILAPADGDFTQPLDIERIRPGEISHLLVADRYQLEDNLMYADPAKPKFGTPYIYRWNFKTVEGRPLDANASLKSHLNIHETRCIRFDGIKPLTSDSWTATNEDRWGISILTRLADDLIQDATINASMAEIIKRACVPVVKVRYFRDMLARGVMPAGEASPEAYAQSISENISAAKVMFIDANDEVGKLEVNTTGLTDIVSDQAKRMAMIEGVPVTRFTGESATGLSATGAGDSRDWRITLDAYRKNSIERQWCHLMEIVAKNAGLSEVPEYEWGKLGEKDAKEHAEIAKVLAEGVAKLVETGIIDETEARDILNKVDYINVVPEEYTPPTYEHDMEQMKMEGKNANRGEGQTRNIT